MWQILIDIGCLIVILIVVGAGWAHIAAEIREEDRKRRNERLMARLFEDRKP